MLVLRMAHRIWKETKQLPGTAGTGSILGFCLVSCGPSRARALYTTVHYAETAALHRNGSIRPSVRPFLSSSFFLRGVAKCEFGLRRRMYVCHMPYPFFVIHSSTGVRRGGGGGRGSSCPTAWFLATPSPSTHPQATVNRLRPE